MLSNATGPGRDPRMLALRAAPLVAGIQADDRKPVTFAPAGLDRYAGVYKDGDGDDWIVRREGDRLEVVAGPSRSEVFASAACADCFFYRDHVRDLRFERSPVGEVTALLIDEHIGPFERAVRAKCSAKDGSASGGVGVGRRGVPFPDPRQGAIDPRRLRLLTTVV